MNQEDHILVDDVDVSLSLLFNLSNIQDKVHQIQSLVSFFMISSNDNNQSLASTSSLAMANIGSLIQEIITTASSMMFTCQQRHIDDDQATNAMVMELSGEEINPEYGFIQELPTNILDVQERRNLDQYATKTLSPKKSHLRNSKDKSGKYEILEVDAANLLAKYTHYCQICGKGFKRDANLRMHMRAHGEEYKTREALISPMRHDKKVEYSLKNHYYSCPQQGCRWNQKHEKFQPLKSMICAKNHYMRSHCPKMYVCRRCNVKQFSVLSDLRTHEKHCGYIKWVCSCGTRFSRKDKLMSHVSLFLGHSPTVAAAAAVPDDHTFGVINSEPSSST